MKYITGEIKKSLFQNILNASVELGGSRIVFWYYPELEIRRQNILLNQFEEYLIGRDKYEPVTLYGGGDDPKPVEETPISYKINKDNIGLLANNISRIIKVCSDIAIYNEESREWITAIIFHERIGLIKDSPSADNILNKANIIFSNYKPDWF
ncbi:MAG TPA: hypothetical protein VGK27_05820 [Candidatus Deferrimicrobiaceae bacterium]|jgi:hypothetical protein